MTSTIAAIIVGIIIWFLERMIGRKDKKDGVRTARPAVVRKPLVQTPPAPPSPPEKPFLSGEAEDIRVTSNEAPMTDTPKSHFTKAQQELRRTIILGEILRRKF